jgi:aryl-alcohol dehydrogenase-like predicted oxidoreductase
MSNRISASLSGPFKLGGDIAIHRQGFGAMRITGKGIWGEPADREEVLRTLLALPELGVNFIDTAALDLEGKEEFARKGTS